MTQTALYQESAGRPVARRGGALAYLFLLGVSTGLLVIGLPETGVSLAAAVAVAVIATLAAVGFAVRLRRRSAQQGQSRVSDDIADFVAQDASPTFTVTKDGEILWQNHAAIARFGGRERQTLTRSLGEVVANAAGLIDRLQTRADKLGSAREDVVTRRGHLRLAAHRLSGDRFLWRFEDMAERPTGGRGADTISLPMLTASRTGTVLFMNDALRRITGERVKTLDRLFPGGEVVSGGETLIATPSGPVAARAVELEGPGGRREIYLLPVKDDAARPALTSEAFHDLPVALLRMTAEGKITATNRLAANLIGTVGENTHLADLFEGLGRSVRDWLRETLAGRTVGKPEVLRLISDEHERYIQITPSPYAGPEGTGLIAVLSDATELKSLEAQFVQSQKMQAIGQLAGGVAHDFNNLLTAISGHCDLLLLRHTSTDPEYGDLMQINQNANRAASLVGQLLAFSRQQTLTPRVLDLRDTLSDLTHLLNRLVGEKVNLSLTHDPSLRPIRADRRQLEQVIMNLVVNARDAMPSGGPVTIVTTNERLEKPLSRDRAVVAAGDYVAVRVTDKGIGIPPDKLPKIFEPFYTTKRTGEGTGLGLSTVYGIVKQTGGFIFCDSVVGTGTTFTLYFPACSADEAQLQPQEPAPPRPTLRSGTGVILLVEDEAPVRAFASRALRLRGYTVIEAKSAEEALKILENPACKVDLFVTDVIMPGMDGPTWVREALKLRPGTKVVFVSGYAEHSFGDDRGGIPDAAFLPKPFSLADLTATVQEQFH